MVKKDNLIVITKILDKSNNYYCVTSIFFDWPSNLLMGTNLTRQQDGYATFTEDNVRCQW